MPMSPPPQVRCGHCGRDNAADAAFCGGCGAAIAARACARCGRGARHDDRFCAGCGARLDDTPPPAAGPSADQRRHLTVMFTDLADSTRLAGELDPEDMRDLYRAYQGACAEAIARQSGYLAHYMGDGVLAYFGFPEAHEDDARLAVAAGLDIVAAAERLRREFGRDDIGVRVGLHTGEVVVAEMGAGARRQENDVVGETPNIAARLQGIADRDAVVISEATRPLVDGWFELESLGAHDLKGVARPIGGHRVIGPTAATSRMDASAGRGLTPLIGRDTELEELLAAWRAVRRRLRPRRARQRRAGHRQVAPRARAARARRPVGPLLRAPALLAVSPQQRALPGPASGWRASCRPTSSRAPAAGGWRTSSGRAASTWPRPRRCSASSWGWATVTPRRR